MSIQNRNLLSKECFLLNKNVIGIANIFHEKYALMHDTNDSVKLGSKEYNRYTTSLLYLNGKKDMRMD